MLFFCFLSTANQTFVERRKHRIQRRKLVTLNTVRIYKNKKNEDEDEKLKSSVILLLC